VKVHVTVSPAASATVAALPPRSTFVSFDGSLHAIPVSVRGAQATTAASRTL